MTAVGLEVRIGVAEASPGMVRRTSMRSRSQASSSAQGAYGKAVGLTLPVALPTALNCYKELTGFTPQDEL